MIGFQIFNFASFPLNFFMNAVSVIGPWPIRSLKLLRMSCAESQLQSVFRLHSPGDGGGVTEGEVEGAGFALTVQIIL